MGKEEQEKKKKKAKKSKEEGGGSAQDKTTIEEKKKKKNKQRKGGAQDKVLIEKAKKKNKEKDEVGDGAQENPADRGRKDEIITDPRFSAVHFDPRFQRVPRRQSKVTIDSRFNRILADKAFSSSSAPVDKRGKPKKSGGKPQDLFHYYHLEVAGRDSSASPSSESELSADEENVDPSDSEDTTSTSEDDADADAGSRGVIFFEEEDVPVIECETQRLAIVNMAWDHIKAVDLYVLLSSDLPKGGQILSVAVYPSEFGLKCMKEEEVRGPFALIDVNKEHNDDDDDDEDDDISEEKLREYERNRQRYYYAVVECDSSTTADHLYKTFDGLELERSSNVLDLRFIPDSMEFKHPPRDVATEAPPDYQALDFHSTLQHSRTHLTWDDDEPRRKILKRKINAEQLDEMEFKDFLASDDGESSDNENDEAEALPDGKSNKPSKKDKYLALIQSGDGSDEDDDKNMDMEVTFNPGLEDISKRILERQRDKKSETVWEAYLRKRSEKRKARKRGSKYSDDDDDDDDGSSDSIAEVPDEPDDFFVEDSLDADEKVDKKSSNKDQSKKKKGGKKHHKERKSSTEAEREAAENGEATIAELELLLADDQGTERSLKGYNLKSKTVKGKKGKEMLPEDNNIPTVDYDDPRFSALLNDPIFALDPTDPQYKRSAAYARKLREKRKGEENAAAEEDEMQTQREAQLPSDDISLNKQVILHSDRASKNDMHELSSLVRRVKRKVGSLHAERKNK